MRSVVAVFLPIFSILSFAIPGHSQARTVADSLMDRWVEIWNADDVEALRDFYHDDIVSSDDFFGWSEVGLEQNIEGTRDRMEVTDGLRIQPIYSYESESKAYQIGRWTLRDPEGRSTGAHVFIFVTTDDGWRLRSAYYVHDPRTRMGEFLNLPR